MGNLLSLNSQVKPPMTKNKMAKNDIYSNKITTISKQTSSQSTELDAFYHSPLYVEPQVVFKVPEKKPDSYYYSKLSEKQLEWMRVKLHSSCLNVINKKSFLTDSYYYAMKTLDKTTGNKYTTASAGMGHSIYAKRLNVNSLMFVNMFDYNEKDKIYNFTKNYVYYQEYK